MPIQRLFLIVLDSLGIGALPDAAAYGDEGSNTLGALLTSPCLSVPSLQRLGLFNIEGTALSCAEDSPTAAFGRLQEQSAGKDTTTGHWELAGRIVRRPFPTYPKGFPAPLLAEFSRRCGRGILCNRPYSGTQVIADYGERHRKTGDLIVYTSADSVFQIAAHEDVVPLEELYRDCEIARGLLTGENGVARVIARPFTGEKPPFQRTPNRHDFSLPPPGDTMLDILKSAGWTVLAVGKIADIFAGRGITRSYPTKGNADGMRQTTALLGEDFRGLCFVNLVDFDMLYGHRNDVDGYATALSAFDDWLAGFLPRLGPRDLLMITADHGCDPSTPSTDHSREYTPVLIYGNGVVPGSIGTRPSFADLGSTVLELFGLSAEALDGTSFADQLFRPCPAKPMPGFRPKM